MVWIENNTHMCMYIYVCVSSEYGWCNFEPIDIEAY